jgi:hypothetical protein
MTFEVEVDAKALRMSKAGSITGPVFVRTSSQEFPSKSWDDFAVVVLGWWSEAILALIQGASEASLRFMDGPYKIRIAKNDVDHVRLELFRGDTLQGNSDASVSEIVSGLREAGEKLLARCDEEQWSNSDVELLRARVLELRV